MHRNRLFKTLSEKAELKVLEEVYWFEAKIREAYWTKYFLAYGEPLVNVIVPTGRRVEDTRDMCPSFFPAGYQHKILMA